MVSKLPASFMWGGALAANQFEGGYDQGERVKCYRCDDRRRT